MATMISTPSVLESKLLTTTITTRTAMTNSPRPEELEDLLFRRDLRLATMLLRSSHISLDDQRIFSGDDRPQRLTSHALTDHHAQASS
jgi:hypothetical protein